MMKVSSPVPTPALAGFVERILVIEHNQACKTFSLPLFANGVPTLLFQTSNGDIDGEPTHYLTLFGQTVFPKMLTIRGNFTLIAYFFQPVALYAIFGISAHELTNLPLSLDLLDAKTVAELKERLLQAKSTEARLKLLNDYVLQLQLRAQNLSPRAGATAALAAQAAKRLASQKLGENLATVQKELYMTERTFQRLFKETIGVGPNLYRRVCRFNRAFQQLNRNSPARLSSIALANGYADQSHYIRSFKEFTGVTPREYLKWASRPV